VAIDNERARAERFTPLLVDLDVPAEISRSTLPQPVDVRHDKIGELVIRRLVDS
jgi:hypothetical protein